MVPGDASAEDDGPEVQALAQFLPGIVEPRCPSGKTSIRRWIVARFQSAPDHWGYAAFIESTKSSNTAMGSGRTSSLYCTVVDIAIGWFVN